MNKECTHEYEFDGEVVEIVEDGTPGYTARLRKTRSGPHYHAIYTQEGNPSAYGIFGGVPGSRTLPDELWKAFNESIGRHIACNVPTS